jgi:hypothetical protein
MIFRTRRPSHFGHLFLRNTISSPPKSVHFNHSEFVISLPKPNAAPDDRIDVGINPYGRVDVAQEVSTIVICHTDGDT